jgi:hypothetical protein
MRATLNDFPLVQNDYLIAVTDRAESVRHDETGTPPSSQIYVDDLFCNGIQGTSCLIHDQD